MVQAAPKRILVTGGAGFVGSHLCDRLVKGGDDVVCVDNFRSFTLAEHGKLRKKSSRTQDKGFKGALEDFVAAVLNGGPAPVNEAELIETSLATIAIMESLREGRRIEIS